MCYFWIVTKCLVNFARMWSLFLSISFQCKAAALTVLFVCFWLLFCFFFHFKTTMEFVLIFRALNPILSRLSSVFTFHQLEKTLKIRTGIIMIIRRFSTHFCCKPGWIVQLNLYSTTFLKLYIYTEACIDDVTHYL